jgi:GLPGLI family protein
MKKTIMLFAFLSMAMLSNAQIVIDVGGNTERNLKTVDSVVFRITYNERWVNDTTKRSDNGGYVYNKDVMRLDIGRHINKFYNYNSFVNDSLIDDTVRKGMDVRKVPHAHVGITWTLFQNYPKGQTIVFDYIWLSDYRMGERTQQPDWQVVPDSTATILGYACTMATAHFKGRDWKAWFAEDIPLGYGPWKLCGLPGLVLKAADTTGQYCFEATGLLQLNGTQPITLIENYKQYEAITQEKFDKAKREISFGESLEAAGFSLENIISGDGDDEKIRKSFKVLHPYNPIEVAESGK